ncbi:hypothetical protein BACCOP_00538, partial [Phocaeicola coprocola DSM 17136]
MSAFSLTLVLRIQRQRNRTAWAKVAIKSERLTPFGDYFQSWSI